MTRIEELAAYPPSVNEILDSGGSLRSTIFLVSERTARVLQDVDYGGTISYKFIYKHLAKRVGEGGN
jgi:hypothetical protein